jgi:DNA-binding XRE family transcriptional regulator
MFRGASPLGAGYSRAVASSARNSLGGFLRASREHAHPLNMGVREGGSRRVAGLRREEVAVLAGVSADYYARLEQGRECHPSAQVVDAIARALRLDADAQGHVYRLAGLSPSQKSTASRMSVHPSLAQLLGSFPCASARILSPAFDVLATNAVADALLPFMGAGRNLIRELFHHPDARILLVDWAEVAQLGVRALRLNAGHFPQDARIREVVQECLSESDEFAAFWNDHEVGRLAQSRIAMMHAQIGYFELTYQAFDICAAPGQQLMIATPDAGTQCADAFAQWSRPDGN